MRESYYEQFCDAHLIHVLSIIEKRFYNKENKYESRFTHVFKEHEKVSPTKYLLNIKIQKAKELVENTVLSMAQISEYVGINDQNYFFRLFK